MHLHTGAASPRPMCSTSLHICTSLLIVVRFYRRYLPGVTLPENITANSDLGAVVEGADIIVMCAPHQYVRSICKQVAGKVRGGGGRQAGEPGEPGGCILGSWVRGLGRSPHCHADMYVCTSYKGSA